MTAQGTGGGLGGPEERYGDWAVGAAGPLSHHTLEQIGAVLYFTHHLSVAAGI
jgi:hypothetical protein